MIKKSSIVLISLLYLIILANGCQTTSNSVAGSAVYSKSFKEYPDHGFNAKAYIQGMSKGGHGLLIWQDPSAELKKYNSANFVKFGDRLLPSQDRFSYEPFIKNLNGSFKNNLTTKQSTSGQSLRIEIAMVECNPGNRAARIFVGMGAGKVAGAAVCEVYEPEKSQPSIRIYARDTGAMSGADSISILNHIFSQVSFRIANTLDQRIGS